ncbi:ferrous iron transport protein B [Roseimaritima ulvae]|uniref:Ferrous iron transport protein B n=1 Tax=Roseimaritima ulvae TaxID=980254 RepID=A0A5B9QNE7_9BACT|nr:ferrous iron transport protein B [Roseimaritima ulvae]QEG40494.1 Ferrous iron transport protein B [Roseimaritima ulvae]
MNLPIVDPAELQRPVSTNPAADTKTVALIGNPNVGKTSLFNRLTNLLAKTSNFSGTTIEHRVGTHRLHASETPEHESVLRIVDLPGVYSLDGKTLEETVTREYLTGTREERKVPLPDALVVVVDATNLERSLFVTRQALELSKPTIVAINLSDLAERQGIEIDCEGLSSKLGCPVVPISARTGAGIQELETKMLEASGGDAPVAAVPECTSCMTCPYAQGHQWAASVAAETSKRKYVASSEWTDAVDRWMTNSWVGPVAFFAVMLTLFSLVFWLAQFPMELLDSVFGGLAEVVASVIPEGDIQSLLTDGVIAGMGGVLVFLPQIMILFFVLTLLEDSGYLSRAVVVVDRWMRRVGLPGQAFVPLLTAHACAIPAIMATRTIENRRDRLVSILVIPLMTCSARLPVYTMIAAMLFPRQALYAALMFAGAYFLGMFAAFAMALLFKWSILPGNPAPLILDLPPYRMPSIKNALRHAWDRGLAFVRDAGTVILLISLAIWALSTYPKLPEDQLLSQMAAVQASDAGVDISNSDDIERLQMQLSEEHSALGRMGKAVQPVFAPLGFDWKTSVGVMASFAAREVVVSTLSILYGMGDDPGDDEIASLHSRLRSAKHIDGTPVFDTATSVSLLVFFVLAMQCLPTQAVTKKETGSWKWAFFQFGYMSVLAYVGAFVARHVILMLGIA